MNKENQDTLTFIDVYEAIMFLLLIIVFIGFLSSPFFYYFSKWDKYWTEEVQDGPSKEMQKDCKQRALKSFNAGETVEFISDLQKQTDGSYKCFGIKLNQIP